MISDYSKKTNDFEELEEEKDLNKNIKTDLELESIRIEIKNLIEDLKSIIFYFFINNY
jgi:hypothetical protein